MKKGQIYEGVVERVDFPNKAVVAVDVPQENGSVVREYAVVKGALPGQKIRFAVSRARKDRCQGKLKEIIATGTMEDREPLCPYFGDCGGCHYQRLSYPNQLDLKKEQVLRLMDAVFGQATSRSAGQPLNQSAEQSSDQSAEQLLEQSWNQSVEQSSDQLVGDSAAGAYLYEGILSSPSEWEYRNKMEFSFGDAWKDGPLTLGLHRKGSFHDIIDVEGCRIVPSDFSKVLSCVRDYAREQNWNYYHKKTHQGLLRHLLVRRASATGEVLVALVTSSQQEIALGELSDRLQSLPLEGKLTGFLHVINDRLGDVVQSDETRVIYGREYIVEKILGLQFRISTFSFFQTNTKGAEVLYQRVREYLLDGSQGDLSNKLVFDLYSGTGTIAQVIAPVSGRVIGVEIVEEAVEAARENAAANGLSNCAFIAGDVLKVMDEIEEKPDYIVLDPPRDGIHPKALRKIVAYGVRGIVYISCKPTSLARDLEVFREWGYEVRRMSNVDLFPETVHVETVVSIQKKNS